MKHTMEIKLDDDLEARIHQEAERLGMSFENLIQEVLLVNFPPETSSCEESDASLKSKFFSHLNLDDEK